MQAMDFEDSNQQNPEPSYGYTGQEASQQRLADLPGQKLRIDDKEQFAEMLIERMKEELPGKLHGEQPSHANQRLLLALTSLTLITFLGALTILGIAFGHISPPGATALGYGLVGTVIVIAIIYSICNKSLRSSGFESNTQAPQKVGKSAMAQPEDRTNV